MNKEQKTIKKIQELVPEICKQEVRECSCTTATTKYYCRDITLEDVFVAYLKKNNDVNQSEAIVRTRDWIIILSNWIPNNSFQDQEQPTKDFIGDLIGEVA